MWVGEFGVFLIRMLRWCVGGHHHRRRRHHHHHHLLGCQVALFHWDILTHSLVHSSVEAARWGRGLFWFRLFFLVRVVKIQDSGLVWFGLVWFGLDWFGLDWFGLVWFGLVWFGVCGTCRDQRRAERMCRLGRRGPQAFNKKILD